MKILLLSGGSHSHISRLVVVIGLVFLILLSRECFGMQRNGMIKLAPEDYFDGPQLTLARAIQAGDGPAVIRLAGTTDLNTPGRQNNTLLFFAVNEAMYNDNPPHRLQIITDLVRAGADPLQPNPGMPGSPAEFAAMCDKGIWLKAMLDGGLSSNARGKLYGTPIIFRITRARNTETLKTLIAYGADINMTNSLGETLIKNALDSSSLEHVKLLISIGADADIKDNLGWSFRRKFASGIKRSRPGSEYHLQLLELQQMLDERDGRKL